MNDEKLVVLIRHGETDWNAQRRWQGQIDIPLNENGRRQARDVTSLIWPLRPERVLSSDLLRAGETARIVAELLSIPLEFSPLLREIAVGEVEGWTQDEVVGRLGQETLERWRSVDPADLDFSFPGGETKQQLLSRGLSALRDLVETSPARSIVVVTHGMFMRTLLHFLFPGLMEPISIANGEHFTLRYVCSRQNWMAGTKLAPLIADEEEQEMAVPSSSWW